MFKHAWIAVVGAAMLAAGCGKSSSESAAKEAPAPAPSAPAEAKPLRIAVVPKGTTHEFWKSVHAGAVKAQRELGNVEVTFRGTEREDDREQQIALIENLVSARYSAIVLAPLDDTALVAPVKMATGAGLPVVIIDSGVKAEAGKDFVSFVATDNRKGGELAGEHMAALLGGKGAVLILRYSEGSASTTEREEGFLAAIAKSREIAVIDPRRYAGVTRASAQEAGENLLAANPKIDGVYCPNESTTYGMLLALEARQLAGKIKFVGFDASEGLVEGLKKGEINALVVQNPMRMGYLGVKAAADRLAGRPVEPRIDTGVALVTRDNMESPEIKELLSPDLASYLGGK